MKSLFIKLAESLLEVLVFALIFLFVGVILYFSIQWMGGENFRIRLGIDFNEQTNPYRLLLSSFLPVLISGLIATILTHTYIFARPGVDLGFATLPVWKRFAQGWLWSLFLVLPGFLLLLIFQQLQIHNPTWNGFYFFGYILFFVIQSGGEEVVTRSFLINLVESRFGALPAVILSASVFAVMHLGNDHFTWIGFFNILLGGLLLALFFIRYRSIWICTGLHAGWNFIQATLLDFNVSGIDVYSFVQFIPVGYPRLTGSSFGYEGSLVAIVIQFLALIYFIRKNKTNLDHAFVPLNRFPSNLPTENLSIDFNETSSTSEVVREE